MAQAAQVSRGARRPPSESTWSGDQPPSRRRYRPCILRSVFLKCSLRRKDGQEHRSWSIVASRRYSDGKVAQRHVLYLGEINDRQRLAGEKTIAVFDERRGTIGPSLFSRPIAARHRMERRVCKCLWRRGDLNGPGSGGRGVGRGVGGAQPRSDEPGPDQPPGAGPAGAELGRVQLFSGRRALGVAGDRAAAPAARTHWPEHRAGETERHRTTVECAIPDPILILLSNDDVGVKLCE